MRAGAALSRFKSDHHVDEAFEEKESKTKDNEAFGEKESKTKDIALKMLFKNIHLPAGRRRRNSSMSSLPKTANKRVSNASSTPVITCEGKEIFQNPDVLVEP